MTFEFDPAKSETNRAKHGIDFRKAQRLWDLPVLRLPSKKPGESRELAIGRIGETYWTAIVTQRGGVIRLISCRRSRDEEKAFYQASLDQR